MIRLAYVRWWNFCVYLTFVDSKRVRRVELELKFEIETIERGGARWARRMCIFGHKL